MRNLKMMADYYNRQQWTILDFFRDSEKMGFDNAAADRKALGEMCVLCQLAASTARH